MKVSFAKTCMGGLLAFISQYMIIPILPVVMAEEMNLSIAVTGGMFLIMVLGMLLIGPFYNYLMDVYRRKSLCLLAFITVSVATVGYTLIDTPIELLLLCLVQGLAFGVGNASIITLGIDVNVSEKRTKGNVLFGWLVRLGMVAGVALGSTVYLNFGFRNLIITSVIIGSLGVLYIATTNIPFRAPIGVPLCSLDRFFLPRTFPLMLNMILISFVPGLLFPLVHFKMRDTFLLDKWTVPYFAIAAGAFLLVTLFGFLRTLTPRRGAISGLIAIVCSISFLILFDSSFGQLLSAVLLGVGLSILTSAFLYFFVEVSDHCQRSTANVSQLLSWKIGVSLGLATSCYLSVYGSSGAVFRVALIASVLAVALFFGVSYPYYRKKKLRD